MNNILALITARGGSKGIHKKNIAPLAGKPLIAWTIEMAKQSRHLSKVLVSTDNEEIAQVAREWGAEVPFMRSTELAQDDSPHIPVMIQAVKWLEENWNEKPEHILLLQPTSPFRSVQDINNSVELALTKNADSVVSVCETDSHPYLSKNITAEGTLKDYSSKPKGYLARQFLPPAYAANGAIYLVKTNVLAKRRTFYTDKAYAYIMPKERSLDIDTPWDLHLAEIIMQNPYNK